MNGLALLAIPMFYIVNCFVERNKSSLKIIAEMSPMLLFLLVCLDGFAMGFAVLMFMLA